MQSSLNKICFLIRPHLLERHMYENIDLNAAKNAHFQSILVGCCFLIQLLIRFFTDVSTKHIERKSKNDFLAVFFDLIFCKGLNQKTEHFNFRDGRALVSFDFVDQKHNLKVQLLSNQRTIWFQLTPDFYLVILIQYALVSQ